jgi:hypothetical protein
MLLEAEATDKIPQVITYVAVTDHADAAGVGQAAAAIHRQLMQYICICFTNPAVLCPHCVQMQQEEELAKQLTLYPGKPRPAPGAPAAQVRLNAAAILREDTVYKKKQLQEAQMIKR